MRFKSFSLLWLAAMCATATCAHAAPDSKTDIESICAATACRAGGVELALRVGTKSYTLLPVGRSPYIMEDGNILIYPGETFAIQYSIIDGKLTSPKFYKRFAPEMPANIVKDNRTLANPDDDTFPKLTDVNRVSDLPENALLISYGQDKETPRMLMVLKSTLPSTLKVDAIIASFRKGDYNRRPTSTCPVMAGKGSYEFWPNALGPMELKNARLLPDDSPMVCE